MPEPAAAPDFPGLLVLVVGPSGAGKDTLIDRAKAAFAGLPVHFPRRVVTRPSSGAEVHDSLSVEEFASAAAGAAFAVRWQAHGLDYAIPRAIETALGRGETVVCNVSRGVVSDLRARYPHVRVVYVDAPLAIRMARIANRGGRSDAPERARRLQDFEPQHADVVVANGGSIERATEMFLAAISAGRTARHPGAR